MTVNYLYTVFIRLCRCSLVLVLCVTLPMPEWTVRNTVKINCLLLYLSSLETW